MPSFSPKSTARLATCERSLQAVFNEVVKHFDCTVLEGRRTKKRQEWLYANKKTKTLQSKHLYDPAQAVDVAPYPIDWRDTDRFYYFAGYVMGTAEQLGIAIRWGGDWNEDTQVRDEDFKDLVHFELDYLYGEYV
jgi:peptidoglycan L-alanyl-D-glutamate endopeptidase CwlK